jgi:hypothetical protein
MTLAAGGSLVLNTNLAVYGISTTGGKVVKTLTGLTNMSGGGGAGGGGGSISVTTKQDEYLALLGSLDSNATYRSPADFSTANGTSTDIFVWGLPFDPELEQIVAIVRWDSTSQINKIWMPQEAQFYWALTGPGQGMITVPDAAFAASDIAYEVIINGPYRGVPEVDDAGPIAMREAVDQLKQLNINLKRLELHLIKASDMEPSDADTEGMN